MNVDTLAKQLLFSTVRITNTELNGDVSTGTGFLFNGGTSLEPSETVAMVISNKHVIGNAARLEFDFLARNASNTGPDLSVPPRKFSVGGADAQKVIGHPDPDVDIALMPLNEMVLAMDEQDRPFLLLLNWWHLPSAATLEKLDVIEELTFIGYPDGWMDEVHGTPIVRQAITATPLMLPFDGEPTFLVDGSVFAGSSGSPVFILNRGSWVSPTEGVVLGDRILLVGIISDTGVRESDIPVQVAKKPFVRISEELDLGFAFTAQAIAETVNHARITSGLPPFSAMA